MKVKSLSRVRLLATPWTAAYQAPPSVGFSRQEDWSGVPSEQSVDERRNVLKLRMAPGPSIHGIFQARVLEWVAIAFSSPIYCFSKLNVYREFGFFISLSLGQVGGGGLVAKSLQSCPTLCNPIDGSLPGSPVPGILQARTLEWVAICCLGWS